MFVVAVAMQSRERTRLEMLLCVENQLSSLTFLQMLLRAEDQLL